MTTGCETHSQQPAAIKNMPSIILDDSRFGCFFLTFVSFSLFFMFKPNKNLIFYEEKNCFNVINFTIKTSLKINSLNSF